jgi:hypothetical protein
MFIEGEDGVAEQRRRRDVAGQQEQPDKADDLLVVEACPVYLRTHEPAGQIVGGMRAAVLDIRQQVAIHLPDGRHEGLQGRGVHPDSRGLTVPGKQGVGPLPEDHPIRDRDAEELGDHDHRQRVGQAVDHVEALSAPELVEQGGGHRTDARREARHHVGRERLGDQATQLPVLRRVHPHKVPFGEELKVWLRGQERAEVGGERGGVRQHAQHVRVAEHLPELLLGVVVDRAGRPVLAEPRQQGVQGR